MTTILRNTVKLKFYSKTNVWLLSRNISCTVNNSHRTENFFNNKNSFYWHLNFERLQSTKNSVNTEKAKEISGSQVSNDSSSSMTMQQKLKKAVAEYGSTVIVFHVGISLTSLSVCYLLISSGFSIENVLEPIGISSEIAMKAATNAGTFAVAYAVHKIFAPVRIMITLTATPFIVRYLRQIGFLKKTK